MVYVSFCIKAVLICRGLRRKYWGLMIRWIRRLRLSYKIPSSRAFNEVLLDQDSRILTLEEDDDSRCRFWIMLYCRLT